jgi:hypothetical protein
MATWRDNNKQRRICIDNGAHTVRVALASDKQTQQPVSIFNACGILKKGKQVCGNKVLDEIDKGSQVVLE